MLDEAFLEASLLLVMEFWICFILPRIQNSVTTIYFMVPRAVIGNVILTQ